MIEAVASILCLFSWYGIDAPCSEPYPPLIYEYSGYTSYYAPGVMSAVIANRQDQRAYPYLPDQLPAVDGYGATLHCQHVGKTADLQMGDSEWTVLITDCAAPDTVPWMLNGPYAIEVDYLLWQEWFVRDVPFVLTEQVRAVIETVRRGEPLDIRTGQFKNPDTVLIQRPSVM